jgi:predicted nucleic acid-binding protein
VKVYFDTNVVLAAFATRGLCADLFAHVLLEHELLVGETVIRELRSVELRSGRSARDLPANERSSLPWRTAMTHS